MKYSKKIQGLLDKGLITADQAEKIMQEETKERSPFMWKLLFWIAGLLTGSGFILIVASNWSYIPNFLKLLGDMALWGGILYGVHWSIINKRNGIKEFFLVMAFLFVGATIGLIAQVFNLDGGWQSFALTWLLLSLPFVLFSKLEALSILWLLLLPAILGLKTFYEIWRFIDRVILRENYMLALIVGVGISALLAYAGERLYLASKKAVVLPKGFADLMIFHMYYVGVFAPLLMSFDSNKYNSLLLYLFVFIFLGIRMAMAARNKNINSFTRNAYIVAAVIVFIFVTHFGSLFFTGFGFILGGALLLLFIYLMRKMSKRIKTLEFFK